MTPVFEARSCANPFRTRRRGNVVANLVLRNERRVDSNGAEQGAPDCAVLAGCCDSLRGEDVDLLLRKYLQKASYVPDVDALAEVPLGP